MQWKRYGWLVLALVAVVLAACTNTGDSSGASGTAAPLTETFTSADGSVSFQYPSGWLVTERILQISIATSQEAIEASSPVSGRRRRTRTRARPTCGFRPRVVTASPTLPRVSKWSFRAARMAGPTAICPTSRKCSECLCCGAPASSRVRRCRAPATSTWPQPSRGYWVSKCRGQMAKC